MMYFDVRLKEYLMVKVFFFVYSTLKVIFTVEVFASFAFGVIAAGC